MKKIFITIFACLMAILTLTLTACDNNKEPILCYFDMKGVFE